MSNQLQDSLESQFLAELLIDDQTAWDAVAPILNQIGSKVFTSQNRAVLFAGIEQLKAEGQPTDPLTLGDVLAKRGVLDAIGGLKAIAEASSYAISAAYVEQHARQLVDAYMMREIGAIGERIRQDSAEGGVSIDDLGQKSIRAIQNLIDSKTSNTTAHIGAFVGDALDAFQRAKANRGSITGIATSLSSLDDLTGGFQAADYIILAARPSTGKTNVALSLSIAASRQVPVLLYSAEMTGLTLAQRALGAAANLNDRRIKRGALADGEVSALIDAANDLSECEIYLNEAAAPDITEIEIEVRKMVREKHIGLVVIDYIGKIRTRRGRSRQEEVAEASARLKGIAKEHGIPVIALAQLNRNVESRSGLPVLSDLREAGDLEQDADVVIFLHSFHRAGVAQIPQGFGKYSGMPSAGLLCFVVAKQRTGPVGVVFSRFVAETGRILPVECDVDAPPVNGNHQYRQTDNQPF